jgi:hypothetical protein
MTFGYTPGTGAVAAMATTLAKSLIKEAYRRQIQNNSVWQNVVLEITFHLPMHHAFRDCEAARSDRFGNAFLDSD